MKTFFDNTYAVCVESIWSASGFLHGRRHETERVAGSGEGSLAEIAGAHSDACFRRIVPVVILEIARRLLDVPVKTVFK
jgi:hypothetical protein